MEKFTVLLREDFEGDNVKLFHVEALNLHDAIAAAVADVNAVEMELGGEPIAIDQFTVIAVFNDHVNNLY